MELKSEIIKLWKKIFYHTSVFLKLHISKNIGKTVGMCARFGSKIKILSNFVDGKGNWLDIKKKQTYNVKNRKLG